ncbi:MAG: hypothetical protein WCS86_02925 [Candidatus Paceibacterota bacterium]
MEKYFNFNGLVQVCVFSFTLLGFLLTALKLPEWGLVSNLVAQPFWLYSSYKSWKNANQIGAFITTLMITVVVLLGVINYWLL